MVDVHKENVFPGESCTTSGVAGSRFDLASANGSAADSRSCLLTYKRRKNENLVRNGIAWDDLEGRLQEKSTKKSNQVTQKGSHALPYASDNSSLVHQRNVLEQICQSLEIEHDLKKCIQDALAFHPETRSRSTVKESVQSCEAWVKDTSQTGSVHHVTETVARCSEGMTSSESVKETDHITVMELFRCTLLDIIMSDNFAQLCNLLLENGIKADKLLDLSCVNSRIKEKAYESSPILFHSDVQQIWAKLQKVGTDMIAISKCLSDKTTSLFREQVGSITHCISDNEKHEQFLGQESDMRKAELTEASALQVHTCRQCREKADGQDTLVCGSCEEVYHISCIEPAVNEIPSRNWYCANCTAKGIESPHYDCIACERLNTGNGEYEAVHEALDELAESSNELVANDWDERFSHCKVCQTKVTNEEDYRICGHSFCPHKFYHVKCLTNKQLVSYGPCWYCPSCLCRTCFVDRDDDMIVLCDGCDHAYHLYCMQPRQYAIPRGKWFCTKCTAGIQRVHKARRSYEKMLNKSRKRYVDGKLKSGEGLNKSGGVDMLLNAAKTLNYEETLAAMGLNDK